ncbi:MAG: hypothetical protein Tsb0014_04080 [Pleurocapsa sp.]
MKTPNNNHNINVAEHHDYQIITVLFAICASFVLGAIPIIFGLGLTPETLDRDVNIAPTELSPWSAVGKASK